MKNDKTVSMSALPWQIQLLSQHSQTEPYTCHDQLWVHFHYELLSFWDEEQLLVVQLIKVALDLWEVLPWHQYEAQYNVS